MQALTTPQPSTSAQDAETILRAWICGDISRLRRALEWSRRLGCSDVTESRPDERLELLSAIASRMILCKDLSAPTESDPQIRLCVSLLAHLVAHPKFD